MLAKFVSGCLIFMAAESTCLEKIALAAETSFYDPDCFQVHARVRWDVMHAPKAAEPPSLKPLHPKPHNPQAPPIPLQPNLLQTHQNAPYIIPKDNL